MARLTKTPLQRAIDVDRAVAELPALVARALDVSGTEGYESPAAKRAWESVEIHGATIHRQARRLAGKSRAG
jgi:hypothetical protein